MDTNMNYNTLKNLHFIYHTTDKDGAMCLEMGIQPIVAGALTDVWTTIETQPSINPLRQLFAANRCQTHVARLSRRAMGNILFVPTYEQKDWFDVQYQTIKRQTQVFVDPLLDSNELRSTYWKIIYNKENVEVAVDGGIQLSPEGYSYNPNYNGYFVRTFL